MTDKHPKAVAERSQTPRAAIRAALTGLPKSRGLSPHQISERAGVPEKDVADHLAHLERSLRQKGGRLLVTPAECLGCGFVFASRKKLSGPSRCPKCAEEHIAEPTFRIEGPEGPDPSGD